MSKHSDHRPAFSLGSLHVDPARNVLRRGEIEFRLEPRVMDVLCELAQHAGEVVSRDTLIDRLWPTEFGADESLTRSVSLIRKALREAGEPSPAIETIKKRGYRLVLPVGRVAPTASDPSRPDQRNPRSTWLAPAVVLAMAATAVLVWIGGNTTSTDTADSPSLAPSVAVLPFVALSDDSSDTYFGLGIAEQLLNALARFHDLRVIARTSAFADGNRTLNPTDLGARLDANYLITGTVRRDGGRLRVTAQLVRATDSASLFANTYEFEASDIFDIEDEIALEIAQALQVQLGVGAAAQRSDGTGVDPAAHEQYLKGLRLWGDRMRENGNRQKALDAFRRAVSFDANFADAWAGLGTVGVYSAGSPLSRDRDQFVQMTVSALNRAIELDPDNPRAHAAMVVFHATQRIDIGAARVHLKQARSAAPNAAATHYAAAWLYRVIGDAGGALSAIDKAIVLDPLNTVLTAARASILIEMGRFEEGMATYEACFQSRCLGEGFVAYASAAAVFTGQATYQRQWRPRIDAFEVTLKSIPDHQKPTVARIMPAFSSIRYDRDDVDSQVEHVRRLFRDELITDTVGIWGPAFADVLPRDTMMDVLHRAYERGDLFSATFALAPMYGVNPYPRWVLEHPRYIALWQRPGMPALAKEWRTRNLTQGLPRVADN